MNKINLPKLSSIISFPFIVQSASKIRIFQAGICLGLAVPIWLTTEAITAPIVKTYTVRVDLSITRLPEENYQTLLRRAETIARAAAQRSFDHDILVTEVSIIVTGQNQGMIAPVLALDVSRDEWRKRPDPRRWVTYFKTAKWLLKFEPLPQTDNTDPTDNPDAKNPEGNQNNTQPNPTVSPAVIPDLTPPPTVNPDVTTTEPEPAVEKSS